jgi:hypothetical protein
MYNLGLYVGYDSRSFVILDGLLGLYGLKYDNVTTLVVAIVLVVLWIGRFYDTSYPNAGEPATTPASGATTHGAEAHARTRPRGGSTGAAWPGAHGGPGQAVGLVQK